MRLKFTRVTFRGAPGSGVPQRGPVHEVGHGDAREKDFGPLSHDALMSCLTRPFSRFRMTEGDVMIGTQVAK